MNINRIKPGFTLIEMLVVVAIIAALAIFGMPAARTLVNSFHADGGTRTIINSALSCARSIAMREQTYAGVRFQKAYTAGDLLDAPQYMVFIVYDPCLSNLVPGNLGCRAVEGMETIKLPEGVGVTDLMIGSQKPDKAVQVNGDIATDQGLRDITAFSVLFSPSGKLIIHDLWVVNRNQDGSGKKSNDDVFNTDAQVKNGIGIFTQDGQATVPGLQRENSRNSFIIYDTKILKQTNSSSRFTKYLQTLQNTRAYINPYTGTLINK